MSGDTKAIHIYMAQGENAGKVFDLILSFEDGSDIEVNIDHSRALVALPDRYNAAELRKMADEMEDVNNKVGSGLLDRDARSVVYPEDSRGNILLSHAEYCFLRALCDANGRAVSRNTIQKATNGREWDPLTRAIDQTAVNLRAKLRDGGIIKTVHGMGYSL